MPLILTEVFNKKYRKFNYGQFLIESENIFNETINITSRQVEYVLEKTKGQANRNLWFRIYDMPPVSLPKKTCYRTKFRLVATDWGCEHEQVAECQYTNLMKNTPSNFLVVDAGLLLSSTYPYLGASPDGIVSCPCCWVGCLEIKCPYCDREKSIDNIVQKSSCIEKVNDYIPEENHRYFYQIHAQFLVTNYEYCDLFLWTKTDNITFRIVPHDAVQIEIVEMSKKFFLKDILPELMNHYFAREESSTLVSNNSGKEDCWCYCRMSHSEDNLFGCDNYTCKIKWFHLKCVLIKKIPKDKWFCPDCKKIMYQQCKIK